MPRPYPKSVELLTVGVDGSTPVPTWHIEQKITQTDGSTQNLIYVLPMDTIEWRCAEYGYDPINDLDFLTDSILIEPHVDDVDNSHADFLYNSDTIEKAKAAHQARFRTHLSQVQLVDNPAAGALADATSVSKGKPGVRDVFRRHSPLDPEVLQIKADHVRRHHSRLAADRAAKTAAILGPIPARPGPEEYRRRLYRPTD